jgi:hypothetical protein
MPGTTVWDSALEANRFAADPQGHVDDRMFACSRVHPFMATQEAALAQAFGILRPVAAGCSIKLAVLLVETLFRLDGRRKS